LQRETLSDIEKRMMRLINRAARSRRFSSDRHSVPGLNVEDELKLVSNKARFLSGVASGDIKLINSKRGVLLQEIVERGFDPIPVEWLPIETGYATDYEKEEDEESPAEVTTGYEYLTSIPFVGFGDDTLHELLKRKSELEEIMRSATPLHHGLTGLKISEKEPSVSTGMYTL
jgi:hypothetical protein